MICKACSQPALQLVVMVLTAAVMGLMALCLVMNKGYRICCAFSGAMENMTLQKISKDAMSCFVILILRKFHMEGQASKVHGLWASHV